MAVPGRAQLDQSCHLNEMSTINQGRLELTPINYVLNSKKAITWMHQPVTL